jgi:hypothetical protein
VVMNDEELSVDDSGLESATAAILYGYVDGPRDNAAGSYSPR